MTQQDKIINVLNAEFVGSVFVSADVYAKTPDVKPKAVRMFLARLRAAKLVKVCQTPAGRDTKCVGMMLTKPIELGLSFNSVGEKCTAKPSKEKVASTVDEAIAIINANLIGKDFTSDELAAYFPSELRKRVMASTYEISKKGYIRLIDSFRKANLKIHIYRADREIVKGKHASSNPQSLHTFDGLMSVFPYQAIQRKGRHIEESHARGAGITCSRSPYGGMSSLEVI